MMPNIDPRTLKAMMDKMGMKQEELPATRVIIECNGSNIVIDNPNVSKITMQGVTTYQIAGGTVTEQAAKLEPVEITQDDIDLVKDKTGIQDEEKIKKALEDSNGDIADAILKLTK